MSVLLLTFAAIASVALVSVLAVLDWWYCQPVANVTTLSGTDTTVAVQRCKFDPLPLGQAYGLIFAAYATLLGSLAAYMAATRRRRDGPQDQK